MKDQRLEKLAKVLVEYATNVLPGDTVCISAEDAALPFIKAVSAEVVKRGGILRYFVDIPEVDAEILKNGNAQQIEQPNFSFGECARSDVWISAWGSENCKVMASVDGEKLKQRRIANMENRRIYSKRMGDGSLRWCGTQFPTNADAQLAGMSLPEYEDFVYEAEYLNAPDPIAKWKELEARQQAWVAYLDTKKELHFIGKNTDIRVGIAGRKWINCCGKENFPDGEIFTSPIENSVNGKITFSYPAIINGHEFEEVCLIVENGQIKEASCKNKENLQNLLSYLDTDEGARRFGEVAIGGNYAIHKHTKNILFDEKIGGSIHMAVGESFQEAGGLNESAIHWDMINDMTQGGKIYADGELFYENGQFIHEVLK